jgi:predicted negative regulator of RcsB-dependent stress response
MKKLSLLALGALCLSSAATAQSSETITVRATDPFAAVAIQSGDLGRAEAVLNSRRFESNDPVRLINLGAVYWLSGRRDAAVSAWRHALAAPVQYDVQTAGGRMRSTDELAREALATADARPIRTASR